MSAVRRPARFAMVLVCARLLAPAPGAAQRADDVPRLAGEPAVAAALDAARRGEAATIADQIRLCEIPAPPFNEAARAAAFAAALREAGLRDVRLDAAGNVLAERPGRSARPHLVLSAHLDTVFP